MNQRNSMNIQEPPRGQNRSFLAKSTGSRPGDESELVSAKILTWGAGLLLAYFGVRLIFFALSISPAVPPDEVSHAGLCKVFSKVLLLPDNSPATYEFGLVTNIPWLYYWIMGKLLHLNFLGISDLVFCRLLNIPLAFGTIYFIRQTLLLLTKDRLAQLLLVVLLTNTAMFSLLSASVSYDNLANLLSAMAIYYLLAFFRERSAPRLAATILCQLAGCLCKITFLPLVLTLNLLLLLHEARNLRLIPAALKNCIRGATTLTWLTAAAMLVALGLNLQLHGGNYLRFETLNPSMTDVVSSQAAMEHRLDARGLIFNQYKEGKISYMEAVIMAGEIRHPGDKADTFYLLMNYEKMKSNPRLWMTPWAYSVVWLENMVGSSLGIKSHLIMTKEGGELIPLYVVMALALLGFIVRWRPRESGWLPLQAAFIITLYAGYFMHEINYESYLNYGAPGLTLYGRYLFPVIGPSAVLFCCYLPQLFRAKVLCYILTLSTTLLLVSYDFPWFLMHATPEWFSWLPR